MLVPGPVQFGRIVRDGIALYFQHLPVIAGIILVYLPLDLFKEYAVAQGELDEMGSFRFEMLASGLVSMLTGPAIVYAMVEPMRTGSRVGVFAALRYGARRWPECFGNRIRAGLRILGGLMLLVVPGLIAMARYALVDEIVALEHEEPSEEMPFERSRALAEDHKAVVFFTLGVAWLGSFSLAILAGMLLAITEHWLLQTAVDTLINIAYATLSCVGLVLYVSLKHPGAGPSWVEEARWVAERRPA